MVFANGSDLLISRIADRLSISLPGKFVRIGPNLPRHGDAGGDKRFVGSEIFPRASTGADDSICGQCPTFSYSLTRLALCCLEGLPLEHTASAHRQRIIMSPRPFWYYLDCSGD